MKMKYTIVKSEQGYADFLVYINRPADDSRPDLWVNTQYETINADDKSLIPVDEQSLIIACRNIDVEPTTDAVETIEETASQLDTNETADLDSRNVNLPGYCTKCHTFCYGDCEASA
jgi:hypothetical protein